MNLTLLDITKRPFYDFKKRGCIFYSVCMKCLFFHREEDICSFQHWTLVLLPFIHTRPQISGVVRHSFLQYIFWTRVDKKTCYYVLFFINFLIFVFTTPFIDYKVYVLVWNFILNSTSFPFNACLHHCYKLAELGASKWCHDFR